MSAGIEIISNPVLHQVPLGQLHHQWPILKTYVYAALKEANNEMDLESVLEWIMQGRMTLFYITEAEVIIGAVTAVINVYPRRCTATIVHASGKSMGKMLRCLPEFMIWAKQNGAESIRIVGRKGWERVLAAYGFEYRYTTVERAI